MGSMADAYFKAQGEAWHRGRAEALSQPTATRYQRNRARVLADLRLWVAGKIAEYSAESEIEQAVDDCLMALTSQGFKERLRSYMLNPNESSLASAIAWTDVREPGRPHAEASDTR
jgi:hypothetical protein